MATLDELAEILRKKNPKNRPMALQWIAERWWPGAKWLRTRAHNSNGGLKLGGLVAGALADRMEKAGLLLIASSEGAPEYCWVSESASTGECDFPVDRLCDGGYANTARLANRILEQCP